MTAGGRRAAWRRPAGARSGSSALAEKGWAPLRYWIFWWALIGLADVVFYVLLTPVWIGLRALAWLAELRARARR